jgi:hypothetical protein
MSEVFTTEDLNGLSAYAVDPERRAKKIVLHLAGGQSVMTDMIDRYEGKLWVHDAESGRTLWIAPAHVAAVEIEKY